MLKTVNFALTVAAVVVGAGLGSVQIVMSAVAGVWGGWKLGCDVAEWLMRSDQEEIW